MSVPLMVSGHHSLLRGTFSPEALLRACARKDLGTVALTDRNSMMGVIPFVLRARQMGIKPLVGVELAWSGKRLTLIARDREGYASCCEAVSGVLGSPGFDPLYLVRERIDHLEVLCADPDFLPEVSARLDQRHLHGAIVRLGGHRPERLRRVARALDIPCVAAGDVHLLEEEDHEIHRLLRTIHRCDLLDRLPAGECVSKDAILLDSRAMARRHRGEEEALDRTRELAERCELELELGQPILPRIPWISGEEPKLSLRRLVAEGARKIYGDPLPATVRERLGEELAVIEDLGFPGYFLVVREIVDFARKERIPFVGRGSAANSLVVRCLGFTRVCPLEHELVFERFLSRSRRTMPDIDLDFCWRRRDRVIDHVFAEHGQDRVAMLATHVSFRFRSAFREVAKAMGLSPQLIDRSSKALPGHYAGGIEEALDVFPECRSISRDPEVLRCMKLADRLRGIPRHLGLHPGGTIIADRSIGWYTPLVRSSKGPLMTQMEMRAVEALGLVKIDILGNRSLSTIADTLETVKAQGGVPIDLDALGGSDPKLADLILQGRTLGCFQVESPGMRKLLIEMRASSRQHLIDAVALIRPGPASSGMKERYIARRWGEEPLDFPHPLLETVLQRSLGILLYQEDISRVCQALVGWSLEDGDLLRNALGKKKDPELIDELRRRYFHDAKERDIDERTAEDLWLRLGDFAAFSYCKAHAATYGFLAYEEVALKAFHPAAFFCALLNNERGYYPAHLYLEEARRMGVRFLGVDINRSQKGFTLDGSRIRIGFGRVKGISRLCVQRIIKERKRRAFGSFEGFLERIKPSKLEARHLVFAGAFDELDGLRPELLWRLELFRPREEVLGHREEGIARGGFSPKLPDYSEAKKRRLEWEMLALTPLGGEAIFGRADPRWKTTPARDIAQKVGEDVLCFGWCSARRRAPTADGRHLCFVTLEDPGGTMEGVLFPDVYLRFGHLLKGRGPFLMGGRVEAKHGAPCIQVNDLRLATKEVEDCESIEQFET